tara:strand:- start:253 stop:1671 length:1419 start_codon:yes stop_codon:yes gene_type:complete
MAMKPYGINDLKISAGRYKGKSVTIPNEDSYAACYQQNCSNWSAMQGGDKDHKVAAMVDPDNRLAGRNSSVRLDEEDWSSRDYHGDDLYSVVRPVLKRQGHTLMLDVLNATSEVDEDESISDHYKRVEAEGGVVTERLMTYDLKAHVATFHSITTPGTYHEHRRRANKMVMRAITRISRRRGMRNTLAYHSARHDDDHPRARTVRVEAKGIVHESWVRIVDADDAGWWYAMPRHNRSFKPLRISDDQFWSLLKVRVGASDVRFHRTPVFPFAIGEVTKIAAKGKRAATVNDAVYGYVKDVLRVAKRLAETADPEDGWGYDATIKEMRKTGYEVPQAIYDTATNGNNPVVIFKSPLDYAKQLVGEVLPAMMVEYGTDYLQRGGSPADMPAYVTRNYMPKLFGDGRAGYEMPVIFGMHLGGRPLGKDDDLYDLTDGLSPLHPVETRTIEELAGYSPKPVLDALGLPMTMENYVW